MLEFQIPSPIQSGTKFQSGFAALLVIVAIGAAALIMAYNASILGLGDLESGYTAQQGSRAFEIADGCLNEALRRLRITPGMTSMSPPPVAGGGYCSVTICQASCVGGLPILVEATGCTAAGCPAPTGGYVKKIRASGIVITSGTNAVTIDKWKEIH